MNGPGSTCDSMFPSGTKPQSHCHPFRDTHPVSFLIHDLTSFSTPPLHPIPNSCSRMQSLKSSKIQAYSKDTHLIHYFVIQKLKLPTISFLAHVKISLNQNVCIKANEVKHTIILKEEQHDPIIPLMRPL